MASKRHDRLQEVFKEIEALAKRLRADVRSAARKSSLTKQVEGAAATLRRRAVDAAVQVEKYAHELRMNLEKESAKAVRKLGKAVRTPAKAARKIGKPARRTRRA